jgi:hypothetical protein
MEERQKKKWSWGKVTQKMCSFKIDLDIVERLKSEANKGRLINNLLRDYYGIKEPAEDEDADPDEHSLAEYEK